MTRTRQGLMLVGCVFAAAMALEDGALSAAPVKPLRKTIVVPAKTSLDVRLATAVRSERNRTEDPVLASLAAPVIVNGVSVAPAASVLLGNVIVESEPAANRPVGTGPLALRFDRLRVGATTYDIRTTLIRLPHDGPSRERFRLELLDPVSIEIHLPR